MKGFNYLTPLFCEDKGNNKIAYKTKKRKSSFFVKKELAVILDENNDNGNIPTNSALCTCDMMIEMCLWKYDTNENKNDVEKKELKKYLEKIYQIKKELFILSCYFEDKIEEIIEEIDNNFFNENKNNKKVLEEKYIELVSADAMMASKELCDTFFEYMVR